MIWFARLRIVPSRAGTSAFPQKLEGLSSPRGLNQWMWGSAYLDRNCPISQSQGCLRSIRDLTTSSVHSIKKIHLLWFQYSFNDS